MAYAAVLSLLQVLENALHSPSSKHRVDYQRQQIESLLDSLRIIAGYFPGRNGVRFLEKRIKDAAYRAEDIVENRVAEHFNSDRGFTDASKRRKFKDRLREAAQEIHSIKKEVIERLKGLSDNRRPRPRPHSSNPPTHYEMVGFEDKLLTLRDRLTNHYQSALQIIPIVGMVGSGKTTLARHLYNDLDIKSHFDVRAWVTVSNDYQPKKVLLDLLGSMKVLTPEMYEENYDLQDDLYKCLNDIPGRYLIVMDDLWGTEVWDDLRRKFPDTRMGSRILLTTRESRVAYYVNSRSFQHHHMRCLNDAESWDLMRGIVFRHRPYHLQHLDLLEEVGKKIARCCDGLPLSIIVISGILSNVSPIRETWESVAGNINSILLEDERCFGLVSLSYDYLPHHLKACFLYTGVFPEDFEIPVSKLVNLWIAEGFLKPSGSESLEEVGEKYLEDLLSRQLILISERSRGKIKTFSIHDLVRGFCLRKAEEENFFHSTLGSSSESIINPRRISCTSKFLGEDVDRAICSSVRSLICLGSHQVPGGNDALHHCKLLKVLELDKVCLKQFPNEISGLVCLGYACFWCEEEEIHIPKVICRHLQNLQTLIILQSSNNNKKDMGRPGVHLPVELWSMSKLRYLKFRNCYLPVSFWNRSLLENLHTLSKISSSSCDVNFFKRTPNMKKLGVRVEKSEHFNTPFSLCNVGNHLPKLEKLEVIANRGSKVSIPENFTLPCLRKLILNGTKLPWKDMKIVASLPYLEELRLINNAFQGSEWEPIENGFCLLKSLYLYELDLEYWIADNTHFPNLVHLHISECGYLKEISPEIGMIQTLETIVLDDASPHAVTWAKDTRLYHQEIGNENFQLLLRYIRSNLYQKINEANEAFERRREEKRKEKRRNNGKRNNGKRNQGFFPAGASHQRGREFGGASMRDIPYNGIGGARFPGDRIGVPGTHRSFNPFVGPGNIRGGPPSGFGGSRI